MILTTNKPTRVTNLFIETVFKTVILKSDIFDHFPICYLSHNSLPQENIEKIPLYIKEHIMLSVSNPLSRN